MREKWRRFKHWYKEQIRNANMPIPYEKEMELYEFRNKLDHVEPDDFKTLDEMKREDNT